MARHSHTPSTHHTSTSTPHHTSTPSHHTTETPHHTRESGPPTGGGKGYRFEPEQLGSMEGRIGATRTKVDGVGQRVASTNFGAQSMGVVGSTMTGTLNNALGSAKQQVAKAGEAVEGARTQTKSARDALQNTDRANADRLNRLKSDGDGKTTPSSTATATSPSGTSASTTSPAGAGGGPPGPPGPPPPPGGGGGSLPPTTPSGGGSTPRSWRDEIKNHFSASEQRELDSAFKKMSEDPRPGEVPGSGRLTQHERELAAEAQKLVTISPDTRMQKVIPPADVDNYLDGRYQQVGGFAARQQDATHMSTPDDLIRGNRLDYPGTKYTTGMPEVHVIEFRAGAPDNYQIPFGAPHGGASGLDASNPAVTRAGDDMITGARTAGVDPNTYHRHDSEWPYSGIGVTADKDMGVPERTMTDRKDFEDGDMMYKYTAAGDKVPVARFDETIGQWVRL
ncbi:hypothetical protein LWP59_00875 [Amycolatopsis acidiphila]|uniref:Uncharacterized protein n=1 Tax=Amycolatopsis acidiphila TaxID=715473 RepID=A0A558AMT2_9PSEU|nr:hypothetical protein [Amycolatopsis acidiphila]TVT25541.1 hypothetical protein FNH06_01640 [Amycolatopsis acidiphila]UIJ60288.1 hypothetical protein LWP59_00875 [Amycolatopsis acidiphila]GHG60266.1 hypothetical protein GCM10017788_13880 [Amycolatopsis acidiphila]